MRCLLFLVVLGGCWTGSAETTTPTQPTAKPEAAPGLVCAQVVAHALEVSRDELTRTAKPDQIERIRIAAIDTCLATRWSQDLLACFNGAGNGDDLGRCQSRMTREQNDDMQKRLTEALQDDNPCAIPGAP